MPKNKIHHFQENKMFPNFVQPSWDEIKSGLGLKGNWNRDFFNNQHPIVLELGCGKGEYTVGLAKKYGDRNYIGVDIKGARMWRGCKTSEEEKLKNIAFLRTRIEFIEGCFGEDEIDEIWITFPDPFPKLKKENSRLTSPIFLNRYRTILKPNGILHLKTDNSGLYNYTLDIIKEHHFKLIYGTHDLYNSDYSGEAREFTTHYETKFLKEGININYLQFTIMKSDRS